MSIRPLFALVAICLAALSLTACQPQTERAPCPSGERCLEYGNGNDPSSLDPQIATATNEAAILRELFEGMFSDGPDGAPVPGVAQVSETSKDGLTWTFHLRPEVWSDGAPLTANDFVFAYRHMLDPKTGSSYAYLLYVLKNAEAVNAGKAAPETLGVRALDDHTLEIKLEHPASYLPQLLKHQSFFPIPEHAVRRWGADWSKPAHFVGNGAYVLSDWRLGDYIRLQKNPRYRDAGHVCFDQVNFYPLNDNVSAERRVLRGEIDINAGIQSNRVPRLRANPDWARYVHSHTYLTTTYLIFNRRDVPALKLLGVRQAISMTVDRSFLTAKIARAGQAPTFGFVPPGIAGYLPPASPHPAPVWAGWSFAQRIAAARVLMARAGYAPEHPLKLTLTTFNSPNSVTFAQAIQADLKSIGVEVDIRQEDGAVIFSSFEARAFQLGVVGWVADFNDPMTFLGLMKSDTGAQNYGDYDNPTYDSLLARADQEPDAANRALLLARAEQMMLDDADIAPILVGVNLNLVNPNITGWVDNDTDIHPIRYLCRNDAAAPSSESRP